MRLSRLATLARNQTDLLASGEYDSVLAGTELQVTLRVPRLETETPKSAQHKNTDQNSEEMQPMIRVRRTIGAHPCGSQ